MDRGFPGHLVVKTLPSNAGSVSSIPGLEAKIPYGSPKKKKTKKKKHTHKNQKQYCNKFNKDFENGPH